MKSITKALRRFWRALVRVAWPDGLTNFLLMIFTGCLLMITWSSQRAYVVLQPMNTEGFAVGQVASFQIGITNIGVLPAYHTTMRLFCAIVRGPNPNKLTAADLAKAEVQNETNERTVFRDTKTASEIVRLHEPISQADFDEIKLGKTCRILIWGIAEYKTLYTNRYTRICEEFGGEGSTSTPPRATGCPFDNDAN
jgi:hypothetical protein